eukprot:30864-Pelagococcus_subviridis.AAC.6
MRVSTFLRATCSLYSSSVFTLKRTGSAPIAFGGSPAGSVSSFFACPVGSAPRARVVVVAALLDFSLVENVVVAGGAMPRPGANAPPVRTSRCPSFARCPCGRITSVAVAGWSIVRTSVRAMALCARHRLSSRRISRASRRSRRIARRSSARSDASAATSSAGSTTRPAREVSKNRASMFDAESVGCFACGTLGWTTGPGGERERDL